MTAPSSRLTRTCASSAVFLALSLTLACDKGGDEAKTDAKAKAGEQKAGDKKAGDKKAGDKKAGDKKAGDAKASDKKTDDTKTAQNDGPCPKDAKLIPGGKFFMGSDSDKPILARARPAHQVEVDPVCLAVHETTVAEYKECVGAGECKPAFRETWWPQGSTDEAKWKKDREVHTPMCNDGQPDRLNHPINCITWAQADAYCKYRGGRLPTEAEWEFAARGSDGRVYPWGDQVPDPERANACDQRCQKWRKDNGLPDYGAMFEADDGYAGTSPVGSYPKGRTVGGLEDMVGNVFEWTADRFYTYSDEFQKNPTGPQEGSDRVIRGGAFNSFKAEFAEPAFRYSSDETAHNHGIGFRCAFVPKGS